MSNNTISLPNKSIFLDFCVIEHTLYEKHERLPKNFFTKENILKSIKTEFGHSELCFFDNKPLLSVDVSTEIINKLIDPRTNIIASIHSNKDESKIIRNISSVEDRFSGLACSNFKAISPYWFSINQINSDGSIDINFPSRYLERMEKDDTLCFYCKRMSRLDGEWFTKGVLLILFVKNYGFIDEIEFASRDHIERLSNFEDFLSNQTKLRDFRKSSLLFELD